LLWCCGYWILKGMFLFVGWFVCFCRSFYVVIEHYHAVCCHFFHPHVVLVCCPSLLSRFLFRGRGACHVIGYSVSQLGPYFVPKGHHGTASWKVTVTHWTGYQECLQNPSCILFRCFQSHYDIGVTFILHKLYFTPQISVFSSFFSFLTCSLVYNDSVIPYLNSTTYKWIQLFL
jgi:hypothetical protein